MYRLYIGRNTDDCKEQGGKIGEHIIKNFNELIKSE